MMLALVVSCLFLAAIAEDVSLRAGQVYHFTTPGYPDNIHDGPGEQNYKFKSAPGSEIITFCEDFRTMSPPEKPCDYLKVTFNDGSKEKVQCAQNGGDRTPVYYISSRNEMTVTVKYKTYQLISCVVRSTEPPKGEEITLTPSDREFSIESAREPFPYMDRLWLFKSSDGSKINLECAYSTRETPGCYNDRFVIDNGAEVKTMCKAEFVEASSDSGKISFRAIFDRYGFAYFRCKASLEGEPKPDLPMPTDPPPVVPKEINVELHAGDIHNFTSPGYPYGAESERSHTIIKLKTGQGSRFLIKCQDFRFAGGDTPCDLYEVKFEDGKTTQSVCETRHGFSYSSENHELTITMKFERPVAISCFARTTEEPKPEIVKLGVSDGVHRIKHSEEPVPYQDKVWVYQAEQGARVSLQCDINFRERNPCSDDFFTVDTGDEVNVFCKYQKFVLFSSGTTMKVRIQLDQYGNERFWCMAQAVTGPNANQHLNVKPEDVDSSERGGRQGKAKTTCDCGRRNQNNNMKRIFNGKETKENEYTWMVGIRDHDNFQRCGGSLITKQHALTAAHCMVDSQTRKKDEIWDTVVVLGVHNTKKDPEHKNFQYIEMKEVFIPEEWWSFEKHYDAAVVVLQKPVVFSVHVGPVCMADKTPKIVNKEIKLTGWGTTENQYASPVLLETKLFVVDSEICSMDPWIMCTYKNGTGSCKGDSGSPLVHWDEETNRYAQVSIVSFGRTWTCTPGQTGNTNVTYLYDWINNIVQKTVPTEKLCVKV